MDVRPLVPDDAVALMPLVSALSAHHRRTPEATAATLHRDLEDGWFWGFGAGEPLAGYVLVGHDARVRDGLRGVALHHVFVARGFRRQGMARALLHAAENDARARGSSYVVIEATCGNAPARDTYVALGYEWRAARSWMFRKAL